MEKNDLFLLSGLSPEEKASCWQAPEIIERTYVKGALIYDRSHAERALALVLEGTVQVIHGRVVMNELAPGEVFGVAALFGGEEPYPTTVLAAKACRVLLIPQQTVSAWMQEYPRVAENYICFLSDRIRFLNARLSTLTAGPADDRLWQYLLTHREPDGTVRVPGGMAGLAKKLGIGRSSLYRSLDALIAAGRLERTGKCLVIKEDSV